jgi:hypothetical protein
LNLTCWTQALLLDGELAAAEPKTLRYRLLHVAARVVRHARRPPQHPAPATQLALGGPARQGVHPAASPAAALLTPRDAGAVPGRESGLAGVHATTTRPLPRRSRSR